MNNVTKQKIVILGAGYGGLLTAVRLQKSLSENEAEIILVNKNDYHYETTWLHEASAGTMHHDRVRYNISDVIQKNKVKFVQDTVEKVNPAEQKVILSKSEIPYDYLVVALGGESETFGIKGLDEHAFTITSVDNARQIKDHLDYQFSTYSAEKDKNEDRLSIVVGGAGFTGIEFLGELVNRIPELCKEYDIDKSKVKVYCVEAAPMILPGFDPKLVSYARALLEKKGVEFQIGTAIKECTAEGVIVVAGEEEPRLIKAGTVVWAAGVRGNSVIDKSGFENMRGRVKVDSYLRVPGYENTFVIGDCSAVINPENDRPYPPTAQIAMQQAITTAKNITSLVKGKRELDDFEFDNKGTVCSLGEHDAIGVVFGKKLTGFSASFMKKVIDNRALFMIGGPSLVFKKGKFNIF